MKKNFRAGSNMHLPKWIIACLLVLSFAALARAQAYRDSPVLISEEGSTRALATSTGTWQRHRLPLANQTLWPAGDASRVTMFVHNLDLMAGEGANAFRADAQTAAGRRYSLPIESIQRLPGLDWIYAVSMRLNPELGDAGDVLVRLAWRGMSSNRVRL